jgi:hypothetical protein
MHFEIVGQISEIEVIAAGSGIRILPLLRERYGRGRWRNLKGVANVRLPDGTIRLAEVHWFEARHRQKEDTNQALSRLSGNV